MYIARSGTRRRDRVVRWKQLAIQQEEGDKLQNVWLWEGELPRLKYSDQQTSTVGQSGKHDSGAAEIPVNSLVSLGIICWQNTLLIAVGSTLNMAQN